MHLCLSFYLLSLFTLSACKVPAESYMSQLSWKDSPLYTEVQPEKRLSLTEPPNPAPGQQPLRVIDLWEQYSDLPTGRYYYVNSITKERSWKPPRRARGHTPNKVRHPTQLVFIHCLLRRLNPCFSFLSFTKIALHLKKEGILRAG